MAAGSGEERMVVRRRFRVQKKRMVAKGELVIGKWSSTITGI